MACADLISAPQSVNVILPAAAELLVMVRGVGDASSRVAAGLGDRPRAADLRDALSSLESALVAADAPAVDLALTRSKAALQRFQDGEMSPDQAPDASAIELALLFIEGSIQRPCAATPVSATSSFASCSSR